MVVDQVSTWANGHRSASSLNLYRTCCSCNLSPAEANQLIPSTLLKNYSPIFLDEGNPGRFASPIS